MNRFVEILKETTKASAFRNSVLGFGSAWIALHVKETEYQIALVGMLTVFVQTWSSYDKKKAKESQP